MSLSQYVCFSFTYMQILIDEGIKEPNEIIKNFIIFVGN